MIHSTERSTKHCFTHRGGQEGAHLGPGFRFTGEGAARPHGHGLLAGIQPLQQDGGVRRPGLRAEVLGCAAWC